MIAYYYKFKNANSNSKNKVFLIKNINFLNLYIILNI
jgi:hypothetical protein